VTEHRRLGDVLLATAGILFAALTYHQYRYFGSTIGPARQDQSPGVGTQARIQSLRSYVASNPDDFRAYTDLAIACYQNGAESYIDGLNALDRARRLGATGEQLFYYAGVMYQGVGLADYATSEFEKYLRHFPDDRDTRVRLANLYLQQKRIEESWKMYQDLQAQDSKDPVILFNMAVIAKEKGQLDDAERFVTELKTLSPALPNLPALELEIQKKRGGK